ncbi:hypothetical protein ACICHK_42585 (plasmid) [Streptomyces sp. AHU1]|uniref:hypothetical protein n=1 Tax=Streptomyces sp. AHU1 TaxID=3377215 RepID=UPI0038783C43
MNSADIPAFVCCIWFGAILAISFLETPLKFRAPGITLPLGLSLGRVVFRALIRVEIVLLVLACAAALPYGTTALVLLPPAAILTTQALILRPRLDLRAQRVISGQPVPRSRLHLMYVAGEFLKLMTLAVAAFVLGATS